jgi:hypothetical protein
LGVTCDRRSGHRRDHTALVVSRGSFLFIPPHRLLFRVLSPCHSLSVAGFFFAYLFLSFTLLLCAPSLPFGHLICTIITAMTSGEIAPRGHESACHTFSARYPFSHLVSGLYCFTVFCMCCFRVLLNVLSALSMNVFVLPCRNPTSICEAFYRRLLLYGRLYKSQ